MSSINQYPIEVLHDGDKRYKTVEINIQGDLVYEQSDLGKVTARLAPNGGDLDYECWVTVRSPEVAKVLIELIKDRFDNQGEFKSWLEDRKIKYNFCSY